MTSGSPPELKNSIGSATTSADAHASSTMPCTSGASVGHRADHLVAHVAGPGLELGRERRLRAVPALDPVVVRDTDGTVDQRDGEHARGPFAVGPVTRTGPLRRPVVVVDGLHHEVPGEPETRASRSRARAARAGRTRRSTPRRAPRCGPRPPASASAAAPARPRRRARPPSTRGHPPANRLGATSSSSRSPQPVALLGASVSPHHVHQLLHTALDTYVGSETRRGSGGRAGSVGGVRSADRGASS